MNPDVIIQDDTWILDTIMNNAEASLLHIECLPHLHPTFRDTRKIHTDFFGLKPSALPEGQLLTTDGNAEEIFTLHMIPIIWRRQHRHIHGTFPLTNSYCRVNGNPDGPVYHFQDDNGWVGDVLHFLTIWMRTVTGYESKSFHLA